MIEFLKGKKSYIVAGCTVVYGLGLLINGQTEAGIAVIMGALGLGAIAAKLDGK
jgi:hypothetical protein